MMAENKKLLIIGLVFPEPNSSAAGSRMMQLMKLFTAQGFQITFSSPAQDSEFMCNLADYGVAQKSIALNNSSFDEFVKTLNPAIVLFDRFVIEEQFGWRVAENCPNALRILDTEDLHCLRFGRQKAFKENRDFDILDLLDEEITKREIASILRSDLSLMISEYEIAILQTVFKIESSQLFYLPFLLDSQDSKASNSLPVFEDRNDFVFIGNFFHEPNWNAVQYLKESIWPLIRKQLPHIHLHIYGAYPSQKVFQLHNEKDGFLVKGRAISAEIAIQNSRVLLAPLRFGAGIKGKLLDAMRFGTPNVTTTIGAESMFGDRNWNGFIEDEPTAFATRAVQLYQDKEIWQQSQKNGFEIIENRYLEIIYKKSFEASINNLLQHLKAHRKMNFLGQLLQHHTLQSTKYLSRWIEEKNRL